MLFLMGITGLAIVGIMSALSSTVTDSGQRMTTSTFAMEIRSHLAKVNTDGRSYCMVHPVGLPGQSYSPRSLGQQVNSLTSAKLQQVISAAKVTQGVTNGLVMNLDPTILHLNSNEYGGAAIAGGGRGQGFLTLMNSRLHSFAIRKTVQAYVINGANQIIVGGSNIKRDYIYLVSAVYENEFYRGVPPTNVQERRMNDTYYSRVPINFAIRVIGSNYSVIDCGLDTLIKSTAFVESCKALGNDFEYVVDNPNPTNPSGQCYAPQYVVPGASLASIDGKKLGQVVSFIPLRAFLCEGAFAGKSLNMPFCTGDF